MHASCHCRDAAGEVIGDLAESIVVSLFKLGDVDIRWSQCFEVNGFVLCDGRRATTWMALETSAVRRIAPVVCVMCQHVGRWGVVLLLSVMSAVCRAAGRGDVSEEFVRC